MWLYNTSLIILLNVYGKNESVNKNVFRDNNSKFYIATLTLHIFMFKLKDVVSLVVFHLRF